MHLVADPPLTFQTLQPLQLGVASPPHWLANFPLGLENFNRIGCAFLYPGRISSDMMGAVYISCKQFKGKL